TYTAPTRYFYRRRNGDAWTPWLPVAANITTDHAVIAPWRGRGHIFWGAITDGKPEAPSNGAKSLRDQFSAPSADQAPVRKVQLQLDWIEYFKGWGEQRSAGPFDPIEVGKDFVRDTVRVFVAPPTAELVGTQDPEKIAAAFALYLVRDTT